MLSHLLLAALLGAAPRHTPAPTATAVIDSAIIRMGGRTALEKVVRVRREMMTQWLRVSYGDRPFADGPSYEMHSDVRDYSIPAWRNTRKFFNGVTWNEIVDIVRDSVSARKIKDAWGPLNIAYVDERRELFSFAPERLLLNARAATDLRLLSDTTIAGVAHQRVSATIDGFPSVLFIRTTDGLPAMVRYHAAQENDFGLVPYGNMEVETWYSRWGKFPNGVILPFQWDTRRVGKPYKRITVQGIAFDTVATADSFTISDSLRTAFLATARKPMHDLPIDSARVLEGSWATFGAFGSPAGAVRVGGQWILLETGQADLSVKRAATWLGTQGGEPTGAFITAPGNANGGISWLIATQRRVQIAPGMAPFAGVILRNHGQSANAAIVVQRGAWQRIGTDSVWVEPIDYPDMPGSMFLYVPSLKWAYSAGSGGGLPLDYLLRKLKERGFVVERTGSSRNVLTPVPAAVLSSAGIR